ncbi:MAG: prepilin-type N-terminal cleavage/methylation domain-containing protein [Prosthecobacter sp.]
MKIFPHRLRAAYTLIEVLAASAVVAVGMSAAVSLSSTLMLQEELTWRVAVVRNYQENMARLWLLGIRDRDVLNFMPDQGSNAVLNQIIFGKPSITFSGTTNPTGLGSMEVAVVSATVNRSLNGNANIEENGVGTSFNIYRPSLPTSLRPPKP